MKGLNRAAVFIYAFIYSGYLVAQNPSSNDYERSEWGGWIDHDNDCLNTRHELLELRSKIEVRFTDDDNCNVLSGEWVDNYTGKIFVNASDVDIDHVIPLKYAFDHGGSEWSQEVRSRFVNDFGNLEIIDDYENQVVKRDKGPGRYLPTKAYQCEYANKWKQIASKYNINLEKEDFDKLTDIIENVCAE